MTEFVEDAIGFHSVFMILFFIIFITIFIVVLVRIVRGIHHTSRRMFGTSDFMEGLQQATERAASEPYSVSGGDALFMPMILRDFPDFNAEWMKSRAEDLLRAYLLALDTGDSAGVAPFGKDMVRAVKAEIRLNRTRPVIRDVHIYQTAISNYVKNGTDCTVFIQIAFSHLDGKDNMHQKRAELRTTYRLKDDGEKKAVSVRCGHCGAPIDTLNAKVCPYCGSANVAILSKAWEWIRMDIVGA